MSQNVGTSPLCFHPVASTDLQLFNNNTTVKRVAAGTTLVFSSQTLVPYQKFALKFSEISETTKEILSVGFTPHPSEDQENLHSLKIVSLQKRMSMKNKTVYFYYTPSGRIHFGVQDKEKGCRDSKLQSPEALWAFVHISNPGTTIEAVNSSTFDWSRVNFAPLDLHPSRGRNVKLVKNVIHKYDKRLNMSYAFTANPLRIGEHITIKIVDLDCQSMGGLTLGLTSTDPSNLEKNLPEDVTSFVFRPGFHVINDHSWSFKLHDNISFVITTDGKMRIWRNDSTLLKEVPVDVTVDLWAFFDISALASVEVFKVMAPHLENFDILPVERKWSEVRNGAFSEKKDSDSDEDTTLCVVCYESTIEAALYPCGHMCMCYGCARRQWRGAELGSCPMCRVKIKDVLKIYKV